ncbi:MAG: Shikimate 5-dehydrogenase I alpha [uncultured Rubrobacteraceae bacterium]|uniref:Shikimate dehydrogenase (NADP(+)) n=1 Tax=uncultured Rubrobacteraceae bacterium TaxID=349277 RepID=A0A6J4NPY8_9ACTN|nr:MAG: Shikimate 5-dehydrogenase I alpha [uncultured Rubrobacteraceae bacterium]
MIGGKTKLLALIGDPVGHSLSPAMHNASFAADGLDFVYVALKVGADDLPVAVRGAAALGLRGFNVTMPHKRAMVPLVDSLDEGARISGAVNTVVIEDGKLRGFNTDGPGMIEACGEAGVGLAGRGVVLLGAGGAAASIAGAFCDEGIGELHIVNRNPEHAGALADKLHEAGKKVEIEVHPTGALDGTVRAPIVVNATPLGMSDDDPLPLPLEYLDGKTALVDAVYRPGRETALVRQARERGATVVTGQRMLLYQGVLAQRLWTGRRPNVEVMDRALS